jgi:hypothetical protein
MKKLFLALKLSVAAVMLLSFCIFTAPSFAADKLVLFMVDSSGSMDESLGGRKKIDIAKEAMANVLGEISEDLPMGLRVYGHEFDKNAAQEDNCKVSELVVPIGKGTKAQIIQRVNMLTPRGVTPIAYSLSKAPDDFTSVDAERFIVLVSDGKETCGGDPLDVIENLKKQGFKFVVHTIGFDVDEETRAQLKAISSTSGGMYLDAGNSKQLTDSLKTVTKEIREKIKDEEEGVPIKPGQGFSTATLVGTDTIYIADILPGEIHYFKYKVNEGDTAEVVYTVTANCVSSFVGQICDPDRVKMSTEGFGGWKTFKPGEKRTMRFSSAQGQYGGVAKGMPAAAEAYFSLQYDGNTSDCAPTKYTFKIRIKKAGQQ